MSSDSRATVRLARVAGLFYLLNAAASTFSFSYGSRALITPGSSSLIVPGNATATVSKILASETLFRVGIVSELASVIAFILLALALYRLLGGVNRIQARLMVAFMLVSVPISFLNVVNELGALELMHGGSLLSAFSQGQLNALAMASLDLHSQGLVVNAIFWGLWLLPFGYLVYKSGFIPRVLGVLAALNGLTWLVGSLAVLLALPFANLAPMIVVLPLGEPLLIAWLLLKGARVARVEHVGRH